MTKPTNNDPKLIFQMDDDFDFYEENLSTSPIYAIAKSIFIENRGAISTRELRTKLNINTDKANKIYDFLKKDIRQETLNSWKSKK